MEYQTVADCLDGILKNNVTLCNNTADTYTTAGMVITGDNVNQNTITTCASATYSFCVEEPEILGSKIASKNNFARLDTDFSNGIKRSWNLVQDIVNVEQPNDRTVFVQFTDGTKEVAVCSENDEFNFETGVLICLFKKIMSNMVAGCDISGSSVYNKIIKYALSKKDATKKLRKKEMEEKKAAIQNKVALYREKQKRENAARRDRIREIKEAIILAQQETQKDDLYVPDDVDGNIYVTVSKKGE